MASRQRFGAIQRAGLHVCVGEQTSCIRLYHALLRKPANLPRVRRKRWIILPRWCEVCCHPDRSSSSAGLDPLIGCDAPIVTSPLARTNARDSGDQSSFSSIVIAATDAELNTCPNVTCSGGHCIIVITECHSELISPLTRGYEVTGAVLMAILVLLAARSIWLLWSGVTGL
ncbi:hypothetical protein IOCL2690_000123600 [Leishmania lindenbergi]|uniref:Uncharacterized protein n=1 Tax=Leishmania lindenbergi TaxID=651832 RepID=A0AAW3AVY0_9TRYP